MRRSRSTQIHHHMQVVVTLRHVCGKLCEVWLFLMINCWLYSVTSCETRENNGLLCLFERQRDESRTESGETERQSEVFNGEALKMFV